MLVYCFRRVAVCRKHLDIYSHIYIFININYLSKWQSQTATRLGRKGTSMSVDYLPSWVPKSTKLGFKIHQVGSQNPPRWVTKSRKISLGRGLEGSWGHLSPKTRPRPKKDLQSKSFAPPRPPILEPKIY